jgi:hypothetical protein
VEETNEPHVNWRYIYGAVLVWLIVMILLMRLFTTVFS